MANKVMIPGAHKSKGMQSGVPVYDEGTYVLSIQNVEMRETNAGTGQMLNIRSKIEDGPTQQDGDEPRGSVFFDGIFIPNEDHPKFDEIIEMTSGRIKSLCDAAGVKIPKSDNVDFDQLVGATIEVDLTVELQENRNTGEMQPRNQVKAYREAT